MCEVCIANFCEGKEGKLEFGEGKRVAIGDNCMEINVENHDLEVKRGEAVRVDKNGKVLSKVKNSEIKKKVLDKEQLSK